MKVQPILIEEFSRILGNMGYFEENPHIAIGVSGGPDSIALMILANDWLKTINGKLTVFTLNHGIRKESKEECDYVKAIAEDKEIAVESLKWNGKQNKTKLMQDTRDFRYDLFANRCLKRDILHLMIGHHLDDRIETLIMREKRIGNIIGLSSIPWIREYKSLRILRPLLNFSKDRIIATCKFHGIKWIMDPSNKNPKYERTIIRNKLKKENSQFKESLKEKINLYTSRRTVYEEMLSDFFVKFLKFKIYGRFYIEKNEFLKLEKDIQIEVLKRILSTNSGKKYPPKQKSVVRLIDKINDECNGIYTLSSNLIKNDQKNISFLRESKKTFNEMKNGIFIKNGDSKIWDFRFLVKSTKQDLFCEPITISNWKNIKKIFFKNQTRKISFEIIKTLPLINFSKKMLIPFVSSMSDLKNEGIDVIFYPSSQLTSNKFLIIN